jgi:hypothetical protein
MTERTEQSERMREAVERKSAEARERAQATRLAAEERSLEANDRQQDQLSPRAKNSGHGKKTADKWNQ